MDNKIFSGLKGTFVASALTALAAFSAPQDAEAKAKATTRKAAPKTHAIKHVSTQPLKEKPEVKEDEVQVYWRNKCNKVEPEREAYVAMDVKSGQILLHQHEKVPSQIASLTKLMTGLLAFEAIGNKKISEDTLVKIDTSWNRRSTGDPITNIVTGWVKPAPLFELIAAAVRGSKNDAAEAVGKVLAGSEAEFVQMMNARARELGMHTTFFNATGLPAKDMDHLGDSVSKDEKAAWLLDIANLQRHIHIHHPQLAKMMGQKDIKLQGTFLPHTLKHMFDFVGYKVPSMKAMWGKSGFTCLSGSAASIVVEAPLGDIILTTLGYKTPWQRNEAVAGLLKQAERMQRLNQFKPVTLEKLEPVKLEPITDIKFDLLPVIPEEEEVLPPVPDYR